jgi:hypothetical protein
MKENTIVSPNSRSIKETRSFSHRRSLNTSVDACQMAAAGDFRFFASRYFPPVPIFSIIFGLTPTYPINRRIISDGGSLDAENTADTKRQRQREAR